MRTGPVNTTTHLEWTLNKNGAKAPFLFVIDRTENATKIKINRFDHPNVNFCSYQKTDATDRPLRFLTPHR